MTGSELLTPEQAEGLKRVTLQPGDWVKIKHLTPTQVEQGVESFINAGATDFSGTDRSLKGFDFDCVGWHPINDKVSAFDFKSGWHEVMKRELTIDQVLNATNAKEEKQYTVNTLDPSKPFLEEEPKQWRGIKDGLPPVGTICEYKVNGSPSWHQCEVLAHKSGTIVAWDDETGVAGVVPLTMFRPILTPEEIAVEEMLKHAPHQLLEHWEYMPLSNNNDGEADHSEQLRWFVQNLYQAGYKK